MLKKVLGTVITRIIVALLTLAIVLVNARLLGPEKVGTISLIILAITIIQLVNGIFGGGALVYLVPRMNLIRLMVPAYLWAILTAVACAGLLVLIRFILVGAAPHVYIIPEGYFIHVLLLALLLSLATVNFMILMGQERISTYNMISLLQVVVLAVSLAFFFLVFRQFEVAAYIKSLYLSYAFAFLSGLWMIAWNLHQPGENKERYSLKTLFRLGSVMQAGNIIQFLNYRVSYYFIEFFLTRAAVGVYSVGVQLSESIWIIAKSIHMVQYSRISNEKDKNYAARLTLNLFKVTFLITFLGLALVLIVLSQLISVIFKPAFHDVLPVMLALSAGILVFSCSIILSPYFSGTGRPVHNTVSAVVGLVFTLVFSLLLIPSMGITGAAWAATMAYAAATIYQLIIFIRETKMGFGDFLLRKKDILLIAGELKSFLKGKSSQPPDDLMIS
jgi:O-antigen/teichoic acid export membrane protein